MLTLFFGQLEQFCARPYLRADIFVKFNVHHQ